MYNILNMCFTYINMYFVSGWSSFAFACLTVHHITLHHSSADNCIIMEAIYICILSCCFISFTQWGQYSAPLVTDVSASWFKTCRGQCDIMSTHIQPFFSVEMYQSITDWAAAPSRKVVTFTHIPARVHNCAELRSQRFNLRSRACCADSARDVTSCAPRVSLPGRHSLSISGEVLPNRLPHRSPAPCVCVRGQNEGVEYKCTQRWRAGIVYQSQAAI